MANGRITNKPPLPSTRLTWVALLVAFLTCVPRLGPLSPGRFLWAEDGNIFMSGAETSGASTLWLPYAGYLQLFPRVIALLCHGYELRIQAWLFLAASLATLCVAAVVLVREAAFLRLPAWTALVLVGLTLCQPNGGEIFFNLTNTQWFTGLAATLLAVASTYRRLAPLENAVLVVGCLSGPFAPIVLPFVVTRRIWAPRPSPVSWSDGILCVTSIVQLTFFLTSTRVGMVVPATHPDLLHLATSSLISVGAALSLGSGSTMLRVAPAVFWLAVAYSAMKVFRSPVARGSTAVRVASVLFIIAALHIVAAIVSYEAPTDGWIRIQQSRYSFIPYALIFLSALVFTKEHRTARFLVIGSAAVLCIFTMRPVDRAELQLESFARFAKVANVTIPINPRSRLEPATWAGLSGAEWLITPSPSVVETKGAAEPVDVDHLGRHVVRDEKGGHSTTYALSDLGARCGAASTLGVKATVVSERPGVAMFEWSPVPDHPGFRSLRRYFNAGRSTLDFAFPKEHGPVTARFAVSGASGAASLQALQVYCVS